MNGQASLRNIARDYMNRVWNLQDFSAIEEMVHDEVILHSLLGKFHGKEQMKKVVKSWLKGFPDLLVESINFLADGDSVAVQWQAKGTHKGEFKGKSATGKSVVYPGVSIYRFKDGKIAEYWGYLDMQHLFLQISS